MCTEHDKSSMFEIFLDCEDDSETSVYEIACSRLAGDAIRKGSSDNVTVMLVEIKNKSHTIK